MAGVYGQSFPGTRATVSSLRWGGQSEIEIKLARAGVQLLYQSITSPPDLRGDDYSISCFLLDVQKSRRVNFRCQASFKKRRRKARSIIRSSECTPRAVYPRRRRDETEVREVGIISDMGSRQLDEPRTCILNTCIRHVTNTIF